jgi:PAS domain S-box-containing protein
MSDELGERVFRAATAPGVGDDAALPGLETLRAVLDSVPGRVVALDASFRYVYVNREFLEFMGLEAAQVLGRDVAQVFGAKTFATYEPVLARLLGGESLRWEGWRDYPDGRRRYVQETLRPYTTSAGAPVSAVIAFNRDLTELKQREAELSAKVEELQHTEALKSAIVDNALAAIVTADEDGRVVEFNPAAERMFGIARGRAIGRPVGELIVPEHHLAAHEAGMARLKAGGAPRIIGKRLEMEARRADGSEFPVEMVLARTETGGRCFYSAFLADLTQQRATSGEIERQREALRQSEKLTAMGSLLAGVAHELNNPLAIVMGRATLLESKCDDEPALRADATRIREAAERCARIVRTFLNMARQRPAEERNVQVNDLVRGAVDLLQYGLRSGGLALELDLAEGLPPVLADGDRLGQIVLNLIVNAQQALAAVPPPRRLRIETGVEARRPDRSPRVWLRVADSGPGVDAVHRERIFDPFFTTKREGMGTGLGLSVSRSVAREHGGELALEQSSPLGGASFRLSVPLSPEPPAVAPAPLAVAEDAPHWRVLVVDDEPDLVELMREVLEGAGFEVASAESGAVALELLREARFDAIVSDLRMPDIDGAALWREVCRLDAALASRMLFVTGDTLSPAASDFLRETACGVVDKPFAPGELVARVRALVAR